MNPKRCLWCGKELTASREDKFCCDSDHETKHSLFEKEQKNRRIAHSLSIIKLTLFYALCTAVIAAVLAVFYILVFEKSDDGKYSKSMLCTEHGNPDDREQCTDGEYVYIPLGTAMTTFALNSAIAFGIIGLIFGFIGARDAVEKKELKQIQEDREKKISDGD